MSRITNDSARPVAVPQARLTPWSTPHSRQLVDCPDPLGTRTSSAPSAQAKNHRFVTGPASLLVQAISGGRDRGR